MDDRDSVFTWSGLFGVTACCCLFFAAVIRFVDGQTPRLLLVTGLGAAAMTLLNWGARYLSDRLNRRKNPETE